MRRSARNSKSNQQASLDLYFSPGKNRSEKKRKRESPEPETTTKKRKLNYSSSTRKPSPTTTINDCIVQVEELPEDITTQAPLDPQDSSSDDEILLLASKSKKKSYKALLRQAPEVKTRTSKRTNNARYADSGADDLRKELDLSDSDSETYALINHVSSGNSRVRHNLKSLVSDLSKRVANSEEREILDQEIHRDLNDSSGSLSDHSFSLIPGAESLSISTSSLQVGTDLQWPARYSFINWIGKDLTPLCSTSVFMKTVNDCPSRLRRLIKAFRKEKTPSTIINTLFKTNCIFSTQIPLPHSLLLWMFHAGSY